MTRLLGAFVLILAAGAGAAACLGYMDAPKTPDVRGTAATRGDILQTVTATGTLQATRTVDVGSQVTGLVKKLYVDYNSIVSKGQLIAEMDPSVIEVQVESARASLDRAAIDLGEQHNALRIDQANREREEQLFAHSLATEQEREQAELQVKEDEALIKQDRHLRSVPLSLGITDGTWTELVSGPVQAGDQLVASVSLPANKK